MKIPVLGVVDAILNAYKMLFNVHIHCFQEFKSDALNPEKNPTCSVYDLDMFSLFQPHVTQTLPFYLADLTIWEAHKKPALFLLQFIPAHKVGLLYLSWRVKEARGFLPHLRNEAQQWPCS